MIPSKFTQVIGVNPTLTAFALIGLALVFGCSSGADALATASSANTSTSVPLQSQTAEHEFSYRLAPAPLKEMERQGRDPPPITLLAAGTENARIADSDRNILRTAEPGGTIFRIQLAPNHERVLLYYGGAKYTVASVDTLENILTLPGKPNASDDVTGFGWNWLDDNHLLGYAHLRSTEVEGKMASEIDALPPRATLLYVYSLIDGAMSPVEIDGTLPQTFSIHEVSGWNVTLLTLDDSRLLGAAIEQTPTP